MATDATANDMATDTPPGEDYKPKNKKEAVKLWQERTSIAKNALEQWAEKSGANRFIQEYLGKFDIFFNGLKGKIVVPPINDIFSYVDADISNTYNRDPHISVNAKSGTILGAKLWEAIINYYWRKCRTKEAVEPQIMDKDLAGYGAHKVGFEVETEGPEEDLKIIQDDLYSDRVDWKDIVWNLNAKNAPRDCMWMAQRIVKPLSVVKNKYPNAKNLKGQPMPEIDKKTYREAAYKDDISIAVLWEIWDKENRERLLIAEGLKDQYLIDPAPWPDYLDEFPFLIYWDLYAPGGFRPLSAIAPWEAQVLEKMVLLAASVNHSKRWNRQLLVKKGAISNNDLDKIERGDDGAIIDYTGTGNLRDNTFILDWGQLPPDFYLIMDRLSQIQRETSGQPEFERGGVTKTGTRTEGELLMIQQGAKGRMDRRVDRFETHLESIARLMMKHLKGNFNFDEAIRITGNTPQGLIEALGDHYDPETGVVSFTPDDIEGDYDVEIKAGSTLPLNRETKTQLLEHIIQTLGQVSEQGVSPLLRTLIAELLDEFDMKSLREAFTQEEQSNDAQAQAQAENDAAMQIKNRSQAAKNVASADKIGAETDAMRLEMPSSPDHMAMQKLEEKEAAQQQQQPPPGMPQ